MKNLEILPADFKLFILPGNMRRPEYREIYQEAYGCWKEIWDKVYKEEMKYTRKCHSDDFSRQEQIVTIFSGGKCAGLAMVRFIDLGLGPALEDSYFRFWPPETLKKVLGMTEQVAVASFFTVHPDFRQMKTGFCMKTLLLSLFLENFNHSQADIMITAARKVTSNEKLCSKLGSKVLTEKIPYLIDGHPVPNEIADLIYWEKKSVGPVNEQLEFLKKSLWKNRVIIVNEITSEEVKHVA